MDTLVEYILTSYTIRKTYRNNISASLYPIGCTGILGIPTPSLTSSLKVYSAETKWVNWEQLRILSKGYKEISFITIADLLHAWNYIKNFKFSQSQWLFCITWPILFNSKKLNHLYFNVKSTIGTIHFQICFGTSCNSLEFYKDILFPQGYLESFLKKPQLTNCLENMSQILKLDITETRIQGNLWDLGNNKDLIQIIIQYSL